MARAWASKDYREARALRRTEEERVAFDLGYVICEDDLRRERHDQRRYEIAREVLAAMVGANVSTQSLTDGESTSWPDSGKAESYTYSAIAVTMADALLAALEATDGR